jgi:hypothetical protein
MVGGRGHARPPGGRPDWQADGRADGRTGGRADGRAGGLIDGRPGKLLCGGGVAKIKTIGMWIED